MCFFKCNGSCGDKVKLSKFALGMAFGLMKGLWLLGLAWAGWLGGYGMDYIARIQEYYPSYGPTFEAGLLGGLFGLICGFIFGFILAWFYNLCLCCCRKCPSGVPENKVKKM